MRYFAICILLLVNACATDTIRISKNVPINPSASKDNSLRFIPEGKQIDFSYNILGAIYTETNAAKSWEQDLAKLLAIGAKQTSADAVIGIHKQFLHINSATGLLVEFADKNTNNIEKSSHLIDILPLGNPDGVSVENAFFKDELFVRRTILRKVESNGYYARLIEDKFVPHNVNEIDSMLVQNIGHSDSMFLLYSWPSYVEFLDYDKEHTKAAVLNIALINKMSGEVVWKSKPVSDDFLPNFSAKDGDAQYVGAVVSRAIFYGTTGKVSGYRKGHLYRIVRHLFYEFTPNYKDLKIKMQERDAD